MLRNNERDMNKELGAGSLMDFGCYTVQIANIFFKGKPESIKSMMTVTGDESKCIMS